MRPSVLPAYARAPEPLDRIPVQMLRLFMLAQQCPTPRLESQAPVGPPGTRHVRKLGDPVAGDIRLPSTDGCLDQLGQRPADRLVEPPGGLHQLLGRGEGALVVPVPVMEQRPDPLRGAQADSLAPWHDLPDRLLNQVLKVGLTASPGSEYQCRVGREPAPTRLGDHPLLVD